MKSLLWVIFCSVQTEMAVVLHKENVDDSPLLLFTDLLYSLALLWCFILALRSRYERKGLGGWLLWIKGSRAALRRSSARPSHEQPQPRDTKVSWAAPEIPSIRRTWSCWSKSRGGHEDDAGAAALLQRQAVRVGAVQPGVGKAFLRPTGLSSTWRVLEINRVSQDMSNPICTFLDRNLS